jgi:hypothetical protein
MTYDSFKNYTCTVLFITLWPFGLSLYFHLNFGVSGCHGWEVLEIPLITVFVAFERDVKSIQCEVHCPWMMRYPLSLLSVLTIVSCLAATLTLPLQGVEDMGFCNNRAHQE